MKISFIEHTRVKSEETEKGMTFERSWDEIVDEFSEFHVVEERGNQALFNFTEFEEGFVRGSTHAKLEHGLVLDIDEGFGYDLFVETFSGFFAFHMYTSWSHRVEKDGEINDRYRVLIPFSEPISSHRFKQPYALEPDLTTVLPELQEMFPFVDPSSFYTEHWFWLPFVHPERQHLARKDTLLGPFLDVNALPQTHGSLVKKPPKPKPRRGTIGYLKKRKKVDWDTFDLYLACQDAGLIIRDRGTWIDIQCPWKHLHTNPTLPSHSSISFNGERWIYKCQHTGHGEKSAYDLKQWLKDTLGNGEWRNMVEYCKG